VAQVVTNALAGLAFLATYAYLLRRARRRGRPAEVQWGWLAAILACAGAAIVLNYLL
jgi:hypothetical protein